MSDTTSPTRPITLAGAVHATEGDHDHKSGHVGGTITDDTLTLRINWTPGEPSWTEYVFHRALSTTEEPLAPGTVALAGGTAYIRDDNKPGAKAWLRADSITLDEPMVDDLDWFYWSSLLAEAGPDGQVLVLYTPGVPGE